MFYRILKAAPGYPKDQQFSVATYNDLALDSAGGYLTNDQGSRYVASLHEARQLIPENARRLPFERTNQFLELYSDQSSGDC